MPLLRKIRLNSDKYGTPVMKVVNYILDDEVAFRHIAMGRRNWMRIDSHVVAENI